jgi:ABC-2 type transport system permease protein
MSQAEALAGTGFAFPPTRRGALRRLVGSEIEMVFRRRRNLALLTVLAAAPAAIGVAVKVSTPGGRGGPQFLDQVTGNGVFLVFTALTITVPLLLPLLIGVVAGDSIAGEAGSGTLRYLLTVPVGRTRLLFAKALAVLTYTAAAVTAVTVVGLGAGAALFGLHPVTLLSGDTVSLSLGLLRTVEVTAYLVVTLTGFLAVGLFISTLTEVPIAAMAATVGVAVLCAVLDQIPQLGSTRNLLFTHNWLGFAEILRATVDWHTLIGRLGVQACYLALFGSAAWARLGDADITA